MTLKRGAALAAVLVVALGLLAASGPGSGSEAAVITPLSCEGGTVAPEDSAPNPEHVDGQWSCPDGWQVLRGTSTTITADALAGVRRDFVAAGLRNGQVLVATEAQVLDTMVVMLTMLRVAADDGITATRDEAVEWLRQNDAPGLGVAPDSKEMTAWVKENVGSDSSSGWLLWGRFNVVVGKSALGPDGGQGLQAAANAALLSQDVVVAPRYGTYDPGRLIVVPPDQATKS
jgi:hypothetical protein